MFLDVVVKKKFLLLSLGWYLLCVVSGNRYLFSDSCENTLSGTITGNVGITSGNHTNFVFCHDLLNLLISVKLI